MKTLKEDWTNTPDSFIPNKSKWEDGDDRIYIWFCVRGVVEAKAYRDSEDWFVSAYRDYDHRICTPETVDEVVSEKILAFGGQTCHLSHTVMYLVCENTKLKNSLDRFVKINR